MSRCLFLVQNHPFRVLLLTWLLVQFLLYQHYGIKIAFDSYRYLAYADALADGGSYWFEDSGKFYSGYTFLLTIILHVVQFPVSCVILLQIILSGLAAIYLYKSTYLISKNKTASALAALFFIIWPDLQFWNLYIHTESVYISLSVFILYFTLVARHFRQYTILVTLLAIAGILRPNGIFLAIAVSAALFYRYQLIVYFKRLHFTTSLVVAAVLFFTLLIAGIFFLEIFSPIHYYAAGQFIQGYEGHTSAIALPSASTTSQPVIYQLISILLDQPIAFLKLFAGKFVILWAQVRPYYSTLHNSVILLFFLPIYYYAGKSFFSIKELSFSIFVLTLALLHTLMATVIAVDWDNRFMVPLLPFIFSLAAIGIASKIGSRHDNMHITVA